MWDRVWTFLSDKPWAILLVLGGLYLGFFALSAVIKVVPGGEDCRTEWDGRSNPYVCD